MESSKQETAMLLQELEEMTNELRGLQQIMVRRIKWRKQGSKTVLNFKSRVMNQTLDLLFRQYPFAFSLSASCLLLFFITILETIPISQKTVTKLSIVAMVPTTVLIFVFIAFVVEEVFRLFTRTFTFKTMFKLFMALQFKFADIYLLIELAFPNSFLNVTRIKQHKFLRSLELYVDFLYLSAMSQSSCGFGDVTPYYSIGRLYTTLQIMVNVCYLSILFSNWIM